MIKFFRKIRQQLIGEGKVRKYLVYALGEILLVVIGILIALQVNNWNQEKKNRIIEAELLQALHQEFTYNQEQATLAIDLLNTVKSDMILMLQFTGPEYNDISVQKFEALISGAGKDELEYHPSIGVVQDIINAGQLNNISNTDLRRKLASWESKLRKLDNQENIVESYREGIKDITIENGNMVNLFINVGLPEFKNMEASAFKTDPRMMLASQKLENLIAYKLAATNSLEANYLDLEKEIREILSLLEQEINQ